MAAGTVYVAGYDTVHNVPYGDNVDIPDLVNGDYVILVSQRPGAHNTLYPSGGYDDYSVVLYDSSRTAVVANISKVQDESIISFVLTGPHAGLHTSVMWAVIRNADVVTIGTQATGSSPVDFPSTSYQSPDGAALVARIASWEGDTGSNNLLGSFGELLVRMDETGTESNDWDVGTGIWLKDIAATPAPNVAATQSTHDDHIALTLLNTLVFVNTSVFLDPESQANNPSPVGSNRIPIRAPGGHHTLIPPRIYPSSFLYPATTLFPRR